MKKFKSIIFIAVIAVFITACQKQPEASFTTNLSEYIAGDIAHLTNTTIDGYSYIWTMPDRTTAISSNADYQINSSIGFATLTFKLDAFSKNGKKTSSVSKSVAVIPASIFSVDSCSTCIRYPFSISSGMVGSNWVIQASIDRFDGMYHVLNYVQIYFAGTTAPLAGTYLIEPNYASLTANQAYIIMDLNTVEIHPIYTSLSGQLEVTITNGKTHVVFNHVTATGPSKISGDITCH